MRFWDSSALLPLFSDETFSPTVAELLKTDNLLKAADCLQLASALKWCEGDTDGAELVCLDGKLRDAAEDEGFCVLPEPPNEEGDP